MQVPGAYHQINILIPGLNAQAVDCRINVVRQYRGFSWFLILNSTYPAAPEACLFRKGRSALSRQTPGRIW